MTTKSILFSTFLCLSSIAFSENLLTKESSGFECDKLPKNVKLLWGKPNEVQLTDEDSYTGNKSLKVNFNKKLLRVFIHTPEQNFKEGETYTISAFVKTSAANMNIPKTFALSPQAYIEYFEPTLKEGKDILYVHFSSAMSGTFNAMNLAWQTLKEKYPEQCMLSSI